MNKNRLYFLLGLIALFSFAANDVAAQKKSAKKKIYNTKKKTTTKTSKVPAVTTPLVVDNTNAVDSLSVAFPKVLPSLRSNTSARQTVDANGRKNEKTPLAYENLREDDELYKQVIWRNINIKERMNLPFGYAADEDNGNQRFINILLKTLKEGINDSTPLVAFNGLDDRFTTPMKLSEVSSLLVGKADTIQVPDWKKDPTGATMRDSVVLNDFNPELVETYQIKEEIIFDRKTSMLHRRTLGIAPLKKSIDAAGNLRGEFPIFWLYYPDLRPVLAKYEAYNPRNAANRLSWEEVFESHYFSSYIVKSTMSNNGNQYISQIIKDPILRLIESDNIKDQIFNFEQSQWSY